MHRLNINLPTPVYERLTEAAKARQQTKTVIVSNALEDFFQKHDIAQLKPSGWPGELAATGEPRGTPRTDPGLSS